MMDAGPEKPMLQSNCSREDDGRRRLKQYLAAVSVSLGAFCAGNSLAWTSPALAQLSMDTNATNQSTAQPFYLTDKEGAMVGGILTIGALAAAIPAGYFADKFGRKKTILTIALSFLICWVMISLAQNAATVIAARFFGGMATGAICVVAPVYIGEIAETAIRGILGSFLQMGLSLGVLFCCIVGSFTTWTALSIVLIFIPLTLAITFFFMPESPVYLIQSNKVEEAENSLQQFRGSKCDITTEFKAIQKEVEESHDNRATIGDMFTSKANKRALVAAVGVLAFQQLSGINAVVFYTVPIFKASGSSLAPEIAGILIALVQVIFSYVSMLIIERANRKFYLMLSSAGMVVFLAALAMYFHLQTLGVDVAWLGFLPITSALLFMAFFSIGYGPVPWMLLGELFAPEIKGVAGGFAILTNWSCAFLVTFFFPLINNSVGSHVSFYILAIFMAVATIYVHFVVPETRGKSLPEIQAILNR